MKSKKIKNMVTPSVFCLPGKVPKPKHADVNDRCVQIGVKAVTCLNDCFLHANSLTCLKEMKNGIL